MTLCVAWKQNNRIYLASDSRLCKITGSYIETISNIAPKVFSIPVRIYSPSPEEKIIFDRDFGFCFTGGYINGSSYADTISEILSSLQIVPYFSNYSFHNILDIAFIIYKQYSNNLVDMGQHEGLCELLFTGICPNDNNMYLYKFSFIKDVVGYTYHQEQVNLSDNEFVLLGDHSAKEHYQQRINEVKDNFTYLHLLSDIISNHKISTIGGQVQCGYLDHVEERCFILCGILDHELVLNDDRWQVQDLWGFRSITLQTSLNRGNILIKRRLLSPFIDKRNKLFDEMERKNSLI